jgi:hypothetical protein
LIEGLLESEPRASKQNGFLKPKMVYWRAVCAHLVLLVVGGLAAARNIGRLYGGWEGITERASREEASPAGHSYSTCGNETEALFRIDRVRLEPEQISRGSTATFRIRAALEAGRHPDNLESALVSMRALYHSTEVFREEDGICDVADACPLPRDGKEFRMVYVKEFPLYTPPGSYDVELRGRIDDTALFCVRVRFRVAFW